MWMLLLALALADDSPADGAAVATDPARSAPRPWAKVRPEYPEAARELGIASESCIVEYTIDERGRPVDVTVSGCSKVFHDAALEAAWQWTFHPALLDGVPVPAIYTLKITFELDEPPSTAPSLLAWAGLGYGQDTSGGGGAWTLGLAELKPGIPWAFDLRVTEIFNLFGLFPVGGLGRADASFGPDLWVGPLRARLSADLGLDRFFSGARLSDYAFRIGGGADLLFHPADGYALQVAARPAWVALGSPERRAGKVIDELALEGDLWAAPVAKHKLISVYLGGGVFLWQENRIAYAVVGIGGMSSTKATPVSTPGAGQQVPGEGGK